MPSMSANNNSKQQQQQQQQQQQRPAYDTHFYCAICGGPFAQVFRTPVCTAPSPIDASVHSACDQLSDLDPKNLFNLIGMENTVIPEEAIEQATSYSARRSQRLRTRAEKEGRRKGVMSEKRISRQAYDGRRISTEQMKWTRTLRALVCCRAANHPDNADLRNVKDAYLTGRGIIREAGNWADAYATIDDEEDSGGMEHPIFLEEDRNDYGFQVYRERGNNKNIVSSIPFHDECWSMLDLAIQVTAREKGIKREMDEWLDWDDASFPDRYHLSMADHMWRYLREKISITGEKGDLADSQKHAVTRLGELDYREAQGCGEGLRWRHDDGCHWLAADPSSISVLDNPLVLRKETRPENMPMAPRSAIRDPFNTLPHEMILEIFHNLSSSDIFSLKMASPEALHVGLPDRFYYRFLEEEFKYLPKLRLVLRLYAPAPGRKAPSSEISWRASFERLRRLMRTPRPSTSPNDEDYGKEWNGIDIGLKNRNRIWKVVKPIAETLVETSPVNIRELGVYHKAVGVTQVVRGYVGVRSTLEGSVKTSYIGAVSVDGAYTKAAVEGVRMWCDTSRNGVQTFCGVEFVEFVEFVEEGEENGVRSDIDRDGRGCVVFGRKGNMSRTIPTAGRAITGFVFRLADGIVCGAQVCFLNPDDTPTTRESTPVRHSSVLVGRDGLVRKIIVPPKEGRFVGLTGFINSAGFIETVGILERRITLTTPQIHPDASVWRLPAQLTDRERVVVPPSCVTLHEREGPYIPEWRTTGAEWAQDVWNVDDEGESTLYGPDIMPIPLENITGYFDNKFLRGLQFSYAGNTRTKLIGLKEGGNTYSMNLLEKERITACVISYDEEGVRGILFVTDHDNVSEVFGPRYLGTHKVFSPKLANHDPNLSYRSTRVREDIKATICGIHGLYDYKDKRFLQLGIMTTQVSGIGAFVPHPPHPPRVIPFGNTDLHGPGTRTWESRPPPSDWATREVSTLRSCCPVRSCYSGWARLKNLSRVSVYGNMKGIMFSYTDGTRDSFFGCIDGHEPVSIQEFAAGERVIGYATLPSELDAPSEMEKLSIVFSSTPNQCGICANVERIFFMTTKNDSERPAHSKCFVQDADFVGLRFDFTAAGLISWAPLFEKPEPCKITFMRSRKSWPFHTRALEREIYSGDRQSMGFPLDNMARIG